MWNYPGNKSEKFPENPPALVTNFGEFPGNFSRTFLRNYPELIPNLLDFLGFRF